MGWIITIVFLIVYVVYMFFFQHIVVFSGTESSVLGEKYEELAKDGISHASKLDQAIRLYMDRLKNE